MPEDLLQLPAPIWASILTEWLKPLTLFSLERALRNTTSQQRYIDILKYEGTVFNNFANIVEHDIDRLLNWMGKWSIKVRKMHINGDGAIDETVAAAFWKNLGSEFQYLSIQRLKPDRYSILQQATAQRKLLKRLQLQTCQDSYSLVVVPYLEVCGASLEVLALSFQDRVSLMLGTAAFPNLHTLGISCPYARWRGGGNTQEFEEDFIRRCPNLMGFNGINESKQCSFLRALTAHCPLLEVLHLQIGVTDTAELTALLHACPRLHTIALRSRYGTKTEDIAAIAEHCPNLRSFLLREPSDDIVAAIAPRLPQLEHLALVSGCSETVLPIHLLPGRCGNLRSLTLSSVADISEPAFITLLGTVPLLEELDLNTLAQPCLSDNILRTLAKGCPHLRRLRCFGRDPNDRDLTVEGFTALLQGCRALEGLDAWYPVWSLAKSAGVPVRQIVNTRWNCAYEDATDWEA